MKIEDFDPNGIGLDNGNYFGFPFDPEECKLVLLSAPWDVTASYGKGTRFGPDAIIGASIQLDLYEPHNPEGWREGVATLGIEYRFQELSSLLKDDAAKVMKHLQHGGAVTDDYVVRKLDRINNASAELNKYVEGEAKLWLDKGKIVGVVGGDHSVPLGLMRALAEAKGEFSILHIDAHRDLRDTYEGFENSHASIMYNAVTTIEPLKSLVSVGVRDYSIVEEEFADNHPKIYSFTDHNISRAAFKGRTWDEQCDLIVERLDKRVYISFDIDGLSPENSPNTGTPVPGGLSYNQAIYLIQKVVESGREIIGFDLCEVSPFAENEWDGNVGARVLYKLCNLALKSSKE